MGFFSARKQAVGVGAAAAVGGIFAVTGVGLPLTPLGAAVAYAAGAFFTPDGRRGATGAGSAQTISALEGELKELSEAMSYKAGHLPSDVNCQWDRIKAALRETLSRPEQLEMAPDQLFVVSRSIRDYVPTSIEAYLALPARDRDALRVHSGRTAHEELEYQMGLLAEELERIRDAGVRGNLQALEDHGRFLDDKFTQSGLRVDGSSPTAGVPMSTCEPEESRDGQLKPPNLEL